MLKYPIILRVHITTLLNMLFLVEAWLCCVQEVAEAEGNVEKAEDVGLELEELELRAKELDTRRTSTISAIRSAVICAISILIVITRKKTALDL